jgi:Ethanolamine utilization protein EutJ (predicted chaperonin)
MHREGSGLVTLRGLTNQYRARFKISFGANVALPEGTTPIDPIVLAIALDGEGIQTSSMISTPGAVDEYNNIYGSIFIDVVGGCCVTVSVRNIGTTSVNVQNANIIVERVA